MCGDFTRPSFAYHQAEHFDNMHNILTPDNNCFLLHAVPNPPTLTAVPVYDSSGDLLEIESQAREGVSG